jgi:lipoprotein NlpI
MNWRGWVLGTSIAFACMHYASAGETSDVGAASKAIDARKYDDAVRLATRGLQGNGLSANDRTKLLAIRGSALVEEARAADAEKDFTMAMALAPDREARGSVIGVVTNAYIGYGKRLFADGRLELAAESFAAAENYSPDDEEAFNWEIVALVAGNQFDKAIDACDRFVAENPTSTYPYREKAFVEEVKSDFADAFLDYTTALRIDPKSLGALAGRGRLYVLTKQFELARHDLEAANSLAPDDVSGVMWLHILHIKTNRDDAAWLRESMTKLSETEWPAPALDYFLGKKTGKQIVDIALHSHDTIYFRQMCDAWFYLGEDALRHGDKGSAREFFQRTVKSCTAEDFEWDAAASELRELR